MRIALLLVCFVALSAALIDKETKQEFKDFLKNFGKNYTNPVEFAKREAIYAKNKLERIAHNIDFKAGKVGWEEDVTEFADMTKEEFLKRLGLGPARNTTEGSVPAHIAFPGPMKRTTLIDWRQKGKVGAVKNQGGCGSCWTFSSTAVVETCVSIATNQAPPDLSEQQFQDCLESKKCSPGGGWPSEAIDMAKNTGQSTNSQYPYITKDGNCHSASYVAKVGQRVSGKTEDDLARMIQNGVVSVALDATVLQSYKSGVINSRSPTSTNHAVTVVAITNNCNGVSQECYVIRNSWGSGWGEQGYFRLARGINGMGIAQVLDTATGCSWNGNGGTSGGSNNGGSNGKYGTIEQTDRPGYDIAQTTASSAADCQAKCHARSDCAVFAFDTCGNTCWFKRSGPSTNNRDCRASGVIRR